MTNLPFLDIPIYQGEEPIRFTAALRYRANNGGVKLGFEWRRVEHQRLAVFSEILFAVAEATGLQAHLGRLKG